MAVVTLAEMMEAGAHFGHQTRRWNPKMSRYIYCARNGVHIIDLVQTAVCMNNAYKWVRSAARSGKRFLLWEPRSKPLKLWLMKPCAVDPLTSISDGLVEC